MPDSTFLSIKISDTIPGIHRDKVPILPAASSSGVAPEVVAAANAALAEQSDGAHPEAHHRISEEPHGELDSEDERLLDKFYQDTRHSNPYVENNLVQPQALWEGKSKIPEPQIPVPQVEEHETDYKDKENQEVNPKEEAGDGWLIDEEFARISEQLAKTLQNGDKLFKQVFGSDDLSSVNEPKSYRQPQQQASYAPTTRLLTSYNPLGQVNPSDTIDSSSSSKQSVKNPLSSFVGATVYGDHNKTKLSLSSKSPVDAIKMHDEMMKEPPHDGKVRVRMYFHRATHDDAKLYGTGPWKYWGHGWGVEYGYDPKRGDKKDHYQRGYTIERAFGRDFCKDKRKCRKPDPEFFVDPRAGGKYSEERT